MGPERKQWSREMDCGASIRKFALGALAVSSLLLVGSAVPCAAAARAAGDSAPMTVALNNLVNTSTGVVEYNVNMAAAIIAAAPTLLVYIVAGRYFVRGLMAGAIKG